MVLADDHLGLRTTIRTLVNVQERMLVVGEASDGVSAVRTVVETLPDVLILDLSMPGLNGAEVTRRIRRTCPGVKILVLTVHDEENYVAELFEAGASGYVLKRSAADALIPAIQALASGDRFIDPGIDVRVRGTPRVRSLDRRDWGTAGLSGAEREVIILLARGLSNAEIAIRLAIEVGGVEALRASSAEKLGLRGRADVLRFAREHGLLDDT